MARGTVIDRAAAELVLQMKERNPKLTTEQIAAVMGFDATTAGRIVRCGSWEAFCEWKAEKARKEREKNRKAAEKKPAEEPEREPEIPGQMKMDLTGAEQKYTTMKVQIPANEPLVLVNEQKMIRFLAGQIDKLYMKMETINDTLSQILRAVRKE